MKIRLLLIVAILALFAQLPSDASISVEQYISEQYMRNNGYSEQTYDAVSTARARALGKPYYGKQETKYVNAKAPVKFLKRLRSYTDPAAEDFWFYHHDTKEVPSYQDL